MTEKPLLPGTAEQCQVSNFKRYVLEGTSFEFELTTNVADEIIGASLPVPDPEDDVPVTGIFGNGLVLACLDHLKVVDEMVVSSQSLNVDRVVAGVVDADVNLALTIEHLAIVENTGAAHKSEQQNRNAEQLDEPHGTPLSFEGTVNGPI